MAIEIVRLRADDFEDAMDFMNLVFSASSPTDFPRLLPALYQPDDEMMGWNWAVREAGRIRAVVGSFPIEWQLGNTRLAMAGIGGVSSHPRRRGAGYMRQLMHHCIARMRDEGKHLSWLGGQRQRYAYFGYEKCGIGHSFTLSKTNLRHAYGDASSSLVFQPLDAADLTHRAGCIELHDAQPYRCQRTAERFDFQLRSWRNKPYIALAPDGRMVGYLVANGSGDSVTEIHAVSEGNPLLEVARAWTGQQSGNSTHFDLAPWHPLVRQLGPLAESVSTSYTGNWQVFKWLETLEALLDVRAAIGPLVDGRICIEIIGYGTLTLEVQNGATRCEKTEEKPAISVDAPTAHRLFFGPLAPSAVAELTPDSAALDQWCPLPLFLGKQDGV